jgi:hypothetical protein
MMLEDLKSVRDYAEAGDDDDFRALVERHSAIVHGSRSGSLVITVDH